MKSYVNHNRPLASAHDIDSFYRMGQGNSTLVYEIHFSAKALLVLAKVFAILKIGKRRIGYDALKKIHEMRILSGDKRSKG